MPDFLEPATEHPEGFPFAEKMAVQKAGLSEEDVRHVRQRLLRKDVDFVYHKKAIFLTAQGLKVIAPQLEPLSEKNAQGGGIAAGECVKLLIVRTDVKNRRMLLACPEGDDPDRPKKTVRVRVRSQEGFRIRTAIEARLVAGYEDLYDLTSRYPRKKPGTV